MYVLGVTDVFQEYEKRRPRPVVVGKEERRGEPAWRDDLVRNVRWRGGGDQLQRERPRCGCNFGYRAGTDSLSNLPGRGAMFQER